MKSKNTNLFKCFYVPSLWLLVSNRISWGLGLIMLIIAIIVLTERIAIKENAFTRKNKIILLILAILLLTGIITSIYMQIAAGDTSGGLIDC